LPICSCVSADTGTPAAFAMAAANHMGIRHAARLAATASGVLCLTRQPLRAEEATGRDDNAGSMTYCSQASTYAPPPKLRTLFSTLPRAMPNDKPGQLAWAVKHLNTDKVRQIIEGWPIGAALIDLEANTLFHIAASEPRWNAQPEAAKEVISLLLQHGWQVVDQKNRHGQRADVVAKNTNPRSTVGKLLANRSHDFQEMLRAEAPIDLVGERSPTPWLWEYLVQDEQRRSWAGVMWKAVGEDACTRWFDILVRDAPCQTMGGVPRKVAWFVSEDCADCPYCYSGIEYAATVFPPYMEEIRKEVCAHCGIPPHSYPNSCNVNVYDGPEGEVGWHSDDEVYFQSLAGDTQIISFSLGAARDFAWRLQGTTETLGTVPLGNGDIMTMEGLFQKHYKHSVPASSVPCGKRVNLTFRWIVTKAHAEDAGTQAM